jgi:AcrR family transcriptional regulator
MASLQTKAHIEITAIQLFNEHGTAAISTRDIAKQAGISSGNLHYHYANKEAIIRAVLETQFHAYDSVWILPEGRPPQLSDFQTMLYQHFQLLWNYRFFYRELLVLTGRDPLLKQRYRAIQQQRLDEIEKLFKTLAKVGVFNAEGRSKTYRDLLTASWIISENWVGHLESVGLEVNEATLQEGVKLVLRILEPLGKKG